MAVVGVLDAWQPSQILPERHKVVSLSGVQQKEKRGHGCSTASPQRWVDCLGHGARTSDKEEANSAWETPTLLRHIYRLRTSLKCFYWVKRSTRSQRKPHPPSSVIEMRFNEKELVCLSRQPSEMAAELGMRGPKKGDGKIRPISFWLQYSFNSRVFCSNN